MNNNRPIILKALLCAVTVWVGVAFAQDPAATRSTPLLRELLTSVDGKQVVMSRVEVPPGGGADVRAHRHPGETVVYIVSGRITSQLNDEAPVVYKAGEAFFEPTGALHARFTNDDPKEPAVAIVIGIRPVRN